MIRLLLLPVPWASMLVDYTQRYSDEGRREIRRESATSASDEMGLCIVSSDKPASRTYLVVILRARGLLLDIQRLVSPSYTGALSQ